MEKSIKPFIPSFDFIVCLMIATGKLLCNILAVPLNLNTNWANDLIREAEGTRIENE